MQLREKLRPYLRPQPGPRPPGESRPAAPERLSDSLDLVRYPTHLGDVWMAEARWPLAYHHGRAPLSDALRVSELARRRLAPGVAAADVHRLAFLDVESTGLAGGTGTLAFLVGVATFEDEHLRLRQLFLADPAAEAALLAALARMLEGRPGIVSFNGRRFDLPLLETRFVLARQPAPFARLEHLDLLQPARRLYGHRLPSCRLTALERWVLGSERGADLPGWAVPRVYFDYLRYGSAAMLPHVFAHNRLDVVSLVALFGALCGAAGSLQPADGEQALALARCDEAMGQTAEAASLYRRALASGAPAVLVAALRGIVRTHRRLDAWDRLEAALGETARGTLPAGVRLEALVELAKLKEHRRRDFRQAYLVTGEALSLLEVLAFRNGRQDPARAALQRRLQRLLRKQTGPAVRGDTGAMRLAAPAPGED